MAPNVYPVDEPAGAGRRTAEQVPGPSLIYPSYEKVCQGGQRGARGAGCVVRCIHPLIRTLIGVHAAACMLGSGVVRRCKLSPELGRLKG